MLAWIVGALVVGAKLFEREEIVETRKIKRPPLLQRLKKMSKRDAIRLVVGLLPLLALLALLS